MDNKSTKMIINVFAGIMGFGLGLVVVSLFLSMINVSAPLIIPKAENPVFDIFSADWDFVDASPAFIVISFVVLIIGIVVMSVDVGIKQFAKKQIKGLNYIALAVIFVGLILVIVSTIVTKNAIKDEFIEIVLGSMGDSEEYEGMTNAQIEFAINLLINFELGIGAIMGIIGGVFATIGGTLLVLPQFDPIQLYKTPEQPAPAVAPVTPVAAPTQPTIEQSAPTQAPVDQVYNNQNNNDKIK